MNQTNPNILTKDVVQSAKMKLSKTYDPVHLLQWAHSANFQMTLDIRHHAREWQAMLQDGKDGKEAKFEVCTPWDDPNDCMDLLIATIYYHPNEPSEDGSVFFITEMFYAVGIAGTYHIESPLFRCKTEQELKDFLEDKETPFKRYLHLEHIMQQMRDSEQCRDAARKLHQRQQEKEEAEKTPNTTNSAPDPEKLYMELDVPKYSSHPYTSDDLNDGMRVVKESINGWWKPRFLVDDDAKKAYEFMNSMLILQTITDEDINWESLNELPEKAFNRAKALSGLYPTFIRDFHDGEAEVTWQINPDGRYFMDDDGYGMTDDEEITLVGKIDRTGKVIQRFCYLG